MKEQIAEWGATVVAILIGLFVSGLWKFRENTHNNRYSDMKEKLEECQEGLQELEKEHIAIVERVDTISKRQERIAQVTDETLSVVGEIKGSLETFIKLQSK